MEVVEFQVASDARRAAKGQLSFFYQMMKATGSKMLLKKEHVTKAMQLTTGDVRHALERSGYYDKISSADFMGMTPTGSFVYDTDYIDLDTGEHTPGTVYIHYTINGVLHADY